MADGNTLKREKVVLFFISQQNTTRNLYSDCVLLKSVHRLDLLIYSEGEQPPPPPLSLPPPAVSIATTITTIATSFSSDDQRWGAYASLSSTTLTVSNPQRGSLAKLQLIPYFQQVAGELSRHARPIKRLVHNVLARQKKRGFANRKFANT